MSGTPRALLQYLVTGGTAAVVDIQGFALLCSAGVPVPAAAACSFAVATIVNFVLTSRWIFHATPTRRRYLAFLAGACIALILNVALTTVGAIYLGLPSVIAKAAAIAATFLLNFWINLRVVFRDVSV